MTPEHPQIPMPDARTFLLPQRAYLCSLRDIAIPARRAALADARAAVSDTKSELAQRVAALAVIGEALQATEDVAIVSSATRDGLPGLPFYVRATAYDPRVAQKFYDKLHKRDEAWFLALAGLRLRDRYIHDLFSFQPALTEEDTEAIRAAYRATAKLLQHHLLVLKRRWNAYARFLHAYKHAGILGHPDLVMGVDENGENPRRVLVAWQRRKPSPTIGAFMARDIAETIADADRTGALAIDLLEHIVDSHLQIFDFIEVDADGTITPRPINRLPWRLWMRTDDVGEENLARLKERLGIVQV